MCVRQIFRSVLAAGAILLSSSASAADYEVIVLTKSVERPIDTVWTAVGDYCAVGAWMNISCEYTSGSGDVGSVRFLAERTVEVMVAKTAYSYTYTMPTATDLYHGTLAAAADGPGSTTLTYTIIYDQEPLETADAKAAVRDRRINTFTRALENMNTLSLGE